MNALVEKLVKAVGRAFYSDSTVVVMDCLLREKYIKEEELAARLKMQPIETRKIIQKLEADMLVKAENIITESDQIAKCYYIDYQVFVNVVRYRIFLMQNKIRSSEKSQLNDVGFQCPTCKQIYSTLQAQRFLSLDFKFLCSNCCPTDNFRTTKSEPYFRLVELDNRNVLTEMQVLSKKLHEQLSNSGAEGERDGILDLLRELKDVQLIHNRPSDNRARGMNASKIVDEDVIRDMKETLEGRKVMGRGIKRSAGPHQIFMGSEEAAGVSISVTIDNENKGTSTAFSSSSVSSSAIGGIGDISRDPKRVAVRDTEFPEFLQNSRVYTADRSNTVGTLPLGLPLGTDVQGNIQTIRDDAQDGNLGGQARKPASSFPATFDDVEWEED